MNEIALSNLGFFEMVQGIDQVKSRRYFKVYESIGVVLVFDLLTGELFGFTLPSEADAVLFKTGQFVIKVLRHSLPTVYLSKSERLEPSDVCSLINVNRIVTLAQLTEAVSKFERNIELKLLYPFLPFLIGERVIYTDGKEEEFGQIEEVDVYPSSVKYHIRTSSGRLNIVFLNDWIKKAPDTRRSIDFHHKLK